MINKIEQTEINSKKISNLPTRPNSTGLYGDKPLSSKDLKERMDALSLLAISKLNEIIEGMAAGGDVAETIKFKHSDNEYSLAELFSMIFKADGLSDVLITDDGKTINTRLSNLSSSVTLLEEDIDDLEADAKKTGEAFNDLEKDLNQIKASKSKVVSTYEFDENKLPTKIYYKVIEPDWINTIAVADKSQSFEVADVKYADKETTITIGFDGPEGVYKTTTIPAGTYYQANYAGVCEDYSADHPSENYDNTTPLQDWTLSRPRPIVMMDNRGKIINVNTDYHSCVDICSATYLYITTFTYEDGSPVTAPLTLYPTNKVTYYDFENLQFTTEEKGNTLLGDVYSYVDEWGNRCYTIYPDYTPNIKPDTSVISLAISDIGNMLYSIKLEALFNGGYKYSLGNKDFSFIGGKDVVADGDGAFSSGRETLVIGNSAHGFGAFNRIRAQDGTGFGYNNIVTGRHGIAFNEGNKVLGYSALGVGDHNTTMGDYDILGGWQNKSRGYANLGQGAKNILDGKYLLGLGSYNNVKGEYNIVQGYQNEVDGNYNDMNGYKNKMVGNSNVVRGTLNKINSSNNKIFGSENIVVETADFNIVNGQKNQINATGSVDNFISGVGNIVEPSPYEKQKNYGYCALLGRYNVCKSSYGTAIGTNLIVDGGYGSQLVLGKFNEVDRYAMVIIGNGSSDEKRSNSIVIRHDGTIVQKSPNGTKYAISVKDDGTLTAKKVTY